MGLKSIIRILIVFLSLIFAACGDNRDITIEFGKAETNFITKIHGGTCTKDNQCFSVSHCSGESFECRLNWWFIAILVVIGLMVVALILSCLCLPCCCLYSCCKNILCCCCN